jgi:PKD repeat protein
MIIKHKLFFAAMSMILLSATALAVPEDNNYSKNVQAKHAVIIKVLAADFDIIPSFSTTPPTLNFNDKSTGSPTSWSWNFGDRTTSTVQNPIHKYSVPRKYTVTFTIKKFGYSDTVKKIILFTGCEKYES